MGGSSLAPEVLRRSFGAPSAPPRPRLDRRRRRARAARRRSTRRGRSSSSPRSPAARSRRCSALPALLGEAGRRRRAASSRSPTRARRSQALGEERGFRARLPQRPRHRRALQRAVATSGSCRPRSRAIDVAALLDGAEARGDAPASDGLDAELRPVAGLRARRARAGRARQADVRRRRRRSRRFGLWVEQLVAESTGKHGKGILPGRRRAARRAGGLRRRPRLRPPARRRRARRGPTRTR